MINHKRLGCAAVAVAWVIAAPAVHAQSFATSKPVRLIIPFAAGGTTDSTARVFGQKLAGLWKYPVVMENRPGAGGNIAIELLAKSPADGHTLLISSASIASNPALYRKLPYDPIKDLTPVTQLTNTTFIFASSPKLPARSVSELISYAKAHPGELNYGSSGIGSPSHLAVEYLQSLTGIDVVHVPYKGDTQSTAAMRSGDVQFGILSALGVLPQIRAGAIQALAVTGSRRTSALPDVPTVSEAGMPKFEFPGWLGIFASGGTSRDIASSIRADFVSALHTPEVVQALGNATELIGSTPEEFDDRYKSDIALYIKLVRSARVPLLD